MRDIKTVWHELRQARKEADAMNADNFDTALLERVTDLENEYNYIKAQEPVSDVDTFYAGIHKAAR